MTTRRTRFGARLLVAATALAALGVHGGARFADAQDELPAPVVQTPEGMLVQPWFEMFYSSQPRPERVRVQLVETGGTRRFRVQRRPYYEDDQSVAGRVIGRLAAGRTYDVHIFAQDREPLVLPAAFTARAPRFVDIYSSSAARGEMVYALVDFAPKRVRFRVAGVPARLHRANGGDGSFAFEVPQLAPGITTATVTASALGRTTEAPQQLSIVSKRHEFSGLVDGERRTCTWQEWSESYGELIVQGSRTAFSDTRSAATGFVVWLPSTFDALTAPVTFTEAERAVVEWFNIRDYGPYFPGQTGIFRSTTCTVTIESIEGTRIRGSFSAHCLDRGTLTRPPDGRELDVTEGRFDVDRGPPHGD